MVDDTAAASEESNSGLKEEEMDNDPRDKGLLELK